MLGAAVTGASAAQAAEPRVPGASDEAAADSGEASSEAKDEASPQEPSGEDADEATEGTEQDVGVPAERRDGFMVGTHIAALIGGASGYPNDATKIDREAYYTNTGIGGGVMGGLWIGGALADWFTVGASLAGGGAWTADYQNRYFGLGLHIDLFPAWALGGAWQDVGLYLEPGVGFTWVHPVDADVDALIDSGGASRLGFGLFYEGVRLWQISLGPFIGGDFLWSGSAFRPAGLVGLRTVVYAGP